MNEIKIEDIKNRLIENIKENELVVLPEPLDTNHFMDNEVLSFIIEIDTFVDRLIENNIKYINILSLEPINKITYKDKFILRCKLYPND